MAGAAKTESMTAEETKVVRVFYRFLAKMEKITYPKLLHKLMVECLVAWVADMLERHGWGLHYGFERLTYHYNRHVERRLLHKKEKKA